MIARNNNGQRRLVVSLTVSALAAALLLTSQPAAASQHFGMLCDHTRGQFELQFDHRPGGGMDAFPICTYPGGDFWIGDRHRNQVLWNYGLTTSANPLSILMEQRQRSIARYRHRQ
ncbi:hypothetical protein [Thioalkalivibrio paradoxus]|nr:hypothetical protein [Thioalkalivibrio paradoxus]